MSSLTCPDCNAKIPKHSMTCPYCGTILEQPEQQKEPLRSKDILIIQNNKHHTADRFESDRGRTAAVIIVFAFAFLMIGGIIFMSNRASESMHEMTQTVIEADQNARNQAQNDYNNVIVPDNADQDPVIPEEQTPVVAGVTDRDLLSRIDPAQLNAQHVDPSGCTHYAITIEGGLVVDLISDPNDAQTIRYASMVFASDLSDWIRENALYDSILKNQIATQLDTLIGMSWGDAQTFLDNISSEGFQMTEPGGNLCVLEISQEPGSAINFFIQYAVSQN